MRCHVQVGIKEAYNPRGNWLWARKPCMGCLLSKVTWLLKTRT